MKILVIPAKESDSMFVVDIDRKLSTFQHLVGGYIEAVHIERNQGENATLFIDDEGKLKHKPSNRRATALVKLFPGDYIVGDAFIAGLPDEEGNDTDAPQWALAMANPPQSTEDIYKLMSTMLKRSNDQPDWEWMVEFIACYKNLDRALCDGAPLPSAWEQRLG